MFQGLGLSQSPASTGSLFGQGAVEQPAQGTVQAPAQRPSLFAPSSSRIYLVLSRRVYVCVPLLTSMIDTTSGLQPPSGSSIFGQPTTAAQAGQTPATTGLPSQQPTTAAQPPTQPAYFSSLLEKGKKRPLSSFQNVSSVELPSLQLGLDDIRKSARGLGSTSPRRGSHMPAITEHKM